MTTRKGREQTFAEVEVEDLGDATPAPLPGHAAEPGGARGVR
jgi:hypothetical protein